MIPFLEVQNGAILLDREQSLWYLLLVFVTIFEFVQKNVC